MESLHSFAKGAGCCSFLIAALVSCSTPEKSTEPAPVLVEKSSSPPIAPVPVAPPNLPAVSEDLWKQGLSRSGLSDRPTLSRDGKKLYFISRDRSLHRQRQLYEVHLETREERRLTFQDGDVFEAVVSEDDGSVYYTSTTDQIKERPVLFYPELRTAPWPTTDIYRMRPGYDIHDRLTDTASYEGFLHAHSEGSGGSFLIASRWTGEDLILIRTSTHKTAFETLSHKPNHLLHSYTTNNKRKWRAWVEEEKDSGVSQIAISAKNQKHSMFKTGLLEVRDIQLMENSKSSSNSSLKESVEILLTGKRQKGFLRQAYLLKLNDNCLQSLMSMDATIADLRLANDSKTLLWTLISGSRSQVFMAPFTAPTSNCEPIE